MMPVARSVASLPVLLLGHRLRRGRLKLFQETRLRRLIAHACRTVPYYRQLFKEAGISPGDIRSLSDLSAIPSTSRKDLQQLEAGEIVSRRVSAERLIRHTTSGSTGRWLVIRRTWMEERLLQTLRWRIMLGVGLRPSDRIVVIGLVRPTHPNDVQLPQELLRRTGLFRLTRIDCRQPLEQILQGLRKLEPDVLTGFPGTLAQLSGSLSSKDRELIRPRLILVGAEVLTPLMRRQIEEAFSAPVFDLYGSYEFNLMSWECASTGEMHICEESMIFEVLNGNRAAMPGEAGEVVGTALHSFAVPLIRYRIGDIAVQGRHWCACGYPRTTIRAVQGRMFDYFSLADGRVIHPYEISVSLKEAAPSAIRQYQLIQLSRSKVLFKVVLTATAGSTALASIRSAAESVLGPQVRFHIEVVGDIPPEPNGKYRVARSWVASQYDQITSK